MTNGRDGLHRITPAMLIVLLAACGPSATEPDLEPEVPVEPTYAYTVDVETRYIDIRGSCDTDIFGDQVPGEFQFHIRLSGPGGARTPHQSSGYNEWNGTMYQRNRGTNINFTNRDYGWENLPNTSGIDIHFRLAEWDGLAKDDRMRDRSATVEVEYALGTRTRRFTLGATGACQATLFYDVTWSRSEVSG